MKAPTTAAPPIEGFHHIALPVHDLDMAERFYVGLLGATLDRTDEGPLHLVVKFHDGPELHLFLAKDRGKSVPVPHPHLALSVDSDVLDSFMARLRAAGIPIDGPRRLGPPGHASVYFADPSGNTLELATASYAGPVLEGPPEVSKLGW